MYVCICNALTDTQVNRAIQSGCTKPRDVYSACGTQPRCGRCVETMVDMLKSAETGTPTDCSVGASISAVAQPAE